MAIDPWAPMENIQGGEERVVFFTLRSFDHKLWKVKNAQLKSLFEQ